MSEKSQVHVPDSIRPYLEQIAERLWAGRAAVMVGAGFSKNAGEGFPDWNELGDLFYLKAHGVKPDPTKQKYENVLRLAGEVDAAIGRPALENLLRSRIPDLSVEPSELHVQLLELPWADVFTTNYDTLLERASAKVVTRRYEPVVNKEDIPYAIKPRIVKLHGSFPSERPFIITEEDYRRYPHEYAPFVNTVQQALLENTFCLIGFSGDDPNFLQWTGWIRDNLGRDNTQKIYLVGVFDLSSARQQLLAERGIIVVDFSCCDGIERHDHKKALSRFFDYMMARKPNVLNWPYNRRSPKPDYNADPAERFNKITEEWRQERSAYPGWLILPYDNRRDLWVFTWHWIHALPDTEKSPPGLDIQYAFELLWRLERCLLPVFDNIAEFCEKILEKYWPFQNQNPPTNCQIHPGTKEFEDLPWKELRAAWLAISVAMLRYYREEGYLDKWRKAEKTLRMLADHLSAEQREFLNYEGYLFNLFILDLPGAKKSLENWRPNDAQPYWMAKRAAALAEIGLLREAETIVRDALESIRKKLNQKVDATDLTLLSLESYAMLLGEYIREAAANIKGELETQQQVRAQLTDRWNQLKGFKCDPWSEIFSFWNAVKFRDAEEATVSEQQQSGTGLPFWVYYHLDVLSRVDGAASFLRFCEEVGLPYLAGRYAYGEVRMTALKSVLHISGNSPFWALGTLFRTGDMFAVRLLFKSRYVYRLSSDYVDQLIDMYLEVLAKCGGDIRISSADKNHNYCVRFAQLMPRVLSTLCCKCSDERKRRILEFVTEIYGFSDKKEYRHVKPLLQQLLSSMSEVERYNVIPDLLKIPFPGAQKYVEEDANMLLNPFLLFEEEDADELLNPFLLLELDQKPDCAPVVKIQSELVNNLFPQLESDDLDNRRWAARSLVSLHNLQLLNEKESKKLGTAIWRKTDQYGLPEGTDFYRFEFLKMPHPEDVDPMTLFKRYIKSTSFPIQENMQVEDARIKRENLPVIKEILGAAHSDTTIWTAEDAGEILKWLLEWWDADKDWLDVSFEGPTVEEFKDGFRCMLELLADVIGPKLSTDSPDEIKTSLNRLLREVREYGLPSLAAEVACLHICPENNEDIYDRIKGALVSNQNDIRRDGLNAIAKIILDSKEHAWNAEDAVSMLSNYLSWCQTRPISSVLYIIVRILKTKPTSFSKSLESATLERLNRLLTDADYHSDNPDLDFDEKVEVHLCASVLTVQLWRYYFSQNLPIPEVVEKWREVCLDPNEFAEVRAPWKDLEVWREYQDGRAC